MRRPLAVAGADKAQLMRELVRYATLAPSSHNTQCWRFRLHDQAIVIAPDLTRRCPVVDPDDHHLHVSLGCATENLVHAALAAGLQAEARYDAGGEGVVAVSLEATRASTTPLCLAIPERNTDAEPGESSITGLRMARLHAPRRAIAVVSCPPRIGILLLKIRYLSDFVSKVMHAQVLL